MHNLFYQFPYYYQIRGSKYSSSGRERFMGTENRIAIYLNMIKAQLRDYLLG